MIRKDQFITEFSRELEECNIAIFAGAGLSVPAGFVNWKQLLKPLADAINLDVDQEYDLISLSQYHVNEHGNNRSDLNDAILNNFSQRTAIQTENHRVLARLPIDTFWTTNYDSLIEDALSQTGKLPDVKYAVDQLPQTRRGRNAVVYKMHGDYRHASTAVLCKEDYEKYSETRGPFITALSGDLVSKTFLFLGLSFSDPNLDYVLSRIRNLHGENQRKHFCILRKEAPMPDDEPGGLEYRVAKQQLFIKDLLRYNIRTVLIDDYSEITSILLEIESLHKRRTIFVSGAAHEYGDGWDEVSALNFVHDLSSYLIGKEYKIVTGLGLGIGSTVVDGALQHIYQRQRRSLTDQLIIRPFPQSLEGQQLWTQYRNDMLDYAGIAIFMFGNKIAAGTDGIALSNGMREEFEIAKSKGVKLLPLGFTGYMAKQLWDEMSSSLELYYPNADAVFEENFMLLGDASKTKEDWTRALHKLIEIVQGV